MNAAHTVRHGRDSGGSASSCSHSSRARAASPASKAVRPSRYRPNSSNCPVRGSLGSSDVPAPVSTCAARTSETSSRCTAW